MDIPSTTPTVSLGSAVATLLNDLAAAMDGADPQVAQQLEGLRDKAILVEELLNTPDDDHSAAELIVLAYAKGEDGGSVDWEDLNLAHAKALDEVGQERAQELTDLVLGVH